MNKVRTGGPPGRWSSSLQIKLSITSGMKEPGSSRKSNYMPGTVLNMFM